MSIQKLSKRQESREQSQSQPKESSGVSARVIGKESKMELVYTKAKILD